jgi:NitT/TauT family transport system ATP-binding protein
MSDSITLDGITKTFVGADGGAVRALENLSFEVEGGSFVSLLGPSGCGKSTALRIIDGVIDADAGGRVLIGGRAIDGPGQDRARVFQTFALLPWKNLRENVELGLVFQRRPRADRRKIALHYLELLGLGEFATKYPLEVSGGMRQRVGLARALALDAPVLLADEPFASVDALTRETLQAELLRIWVATRKTLIFVTHSIDEAIFLSDRILVFSPRPGRIALDIAVELPRPRTNVQQHPRFGQLRKTIWDTFVSLGVIGTGQGKGSAVQPSEREVPAG